MIYAIKTSKDNADFGEYSGIFNVQLDRVPCSLTVNRKTDTINLELQGTMQEFIIRENITKEYNQLIIEYVRN